MAIYSNGDKTLIVKLDEYNEMSPREWDNLGTMITWERSYNSPDKNTYRTPEDFLEELSDDYLPEDTRDSEKFKLLREKMVILPVYRYEHSGIAYSTTEFSDPWDSGQVGFIYVTEDTIKRNFYNIPFNEALDKVKKICEKEVEIYSQWANGDTYTCEVFKGLHSLDICGGFYNIADAVEDMGHDNDFNIHSDDVKQFGVENSPEWEEFDINDFIKENYPDKYEILEYQELVEKRDELNKIIEEKSSNVSLESIKNEDYGKSEQEQPNTKNSQSHNNSER